MDQSFRTEKEKISKFHIEEGIEVATEETSEVVEVAIKIEKIEGATEVDIEEEEDNKTEKEVVILKTSLDLDHIQEEIESPNREAVEVEGKEIE